MSKFKNISLTVGAIRNGDDSEVRLVFSCAVKEVRMTADEAEGHVREVTEAVQEIRRLENANAGIDTGIL